MTHITDCEQLVMKCVWDSEEDLSMMQMVDLVQEKYGKVWKPQTISTFLARLVKKGYLEMTRHGRVFFYHQIIEHQDYVQTLSKEYVDFWFKGDASSFIDAVKKERGLTEEEVTKLKELC